MLNFMKFSPEEDAFLVSEFYTLKISRLAIKLDRPYYVVEARCVDLGLTRKIGSGKYYSDDEIEYNLLVNGCTEEEIRKLRGSRNIFSSDYTVSPSDED